MKLIEKILFIVFFILFNNVYSKDPYPKNLNIDILNYSFELHLNDTNDVIYGIANIKLNIKPSEKNVRLDLISKNSNGKWMVIEDVLFNEKSIKHNGRRITNNNEINAIKKISGEILLDLYSIFSKNNINSFPIPISRKDLIIASKRPITKGVNYGNVGDVESIDNIHFQNYFENHDLIIMPSLVLDKNTSEILNINADTIATEVAVAIKANKLIFISDVEYIADNEGKRISVINESDLNKLIKNKTIKDGMVVKVENIFRALKKGTEKVHMICGTKKNCLLNELNTEEGVGTEFKKNYVEY